MQTTMQMLKTHPGTGQMDLEQLAGTITQLNICAQACTTCADACIGEQEVQSLVSCIRINQNCADVCTATGAMLSRVTNARSDLLHSMLGACVKACSLCADECEKHAAMHAHCKVCADVCRQCEKACREMSG